MSKLHNTVIWQQPGRFCPPSYLAWSLRGKGCGPTEASPSPCLTTPPQNISPLYLFINTTISFLQPLFCSKASLGLVSMVHIPLSTTVFLLYTKMVYSVLIIASYNFSSPRSKVICISPLNQQGHIFFPITSTLPGTNFYVSYISVVLKKKKTTMMKSNLWKILFWLMVLEE